MNSKSSKPGNKPSFERRSDSVEQTILERIISDEYKQGSRLPLERELAEELGVGRSTVRESIQRLDRDGWLNVRKGSGTHINDYWETGTLNIIQPLLRYGDQAAEGELYIWLAEMRISLTPHYVRLAVDLSPARVIAVLAESESLPEQAAAYAKFDMQWQLELARMLPNKVFRLWLLTFLNTLGESDIGIRYFGEQKFCEDSKNFYQTLLKAVMAGDGEQAEEATRQAMIAAHRNFGLLLAQEIL